MSDTELTPGFIALRREKARAIMHTPLSVRWFNGMAYLINSQGWQLASFSIGAGKMPDAVADAVNNLPAALDEIERLEAEVGKLGARIVDLKAELTESEKGRNQAQRNCVREVTLLAEEQEAHAKTRAELEAARAEIQTFRADNRRMAISNEAMDIALHRIISWCDAYPLDVFPEPDFKRVRELLEAGGITLDGVSASNMRHVINGFRELAKAAIDALRA